jgi:hypothetical protein
VRKERHGYGKRFNNLKKLMIQDGCDGILRLATTGTPATIVFRNKY